MNWPVDPLGLRNVELEVSERLQQGKLPRAYFSGGENFVNTWKRTRHNQDRQFDYSIPTE